MRIKDFKEIDNPIIICNEEHRFIVAEQLRVLNIKAKSILLEPVARNTAPAITIAAIKSIERGNNPNLLVLPSDHLIKDLGEFERTLRSAIEFCDQGKLITFGIIPTKPETGYGYIEASEVLDNKKLKAEKIIRFIEKPEERVAKSLIKDKRFTWNSGMFLFNANIFLNEIKKRTPNIFEKCNLALSTSLRDLDFQRIEEGAFSLCQDISVDKAIMEKTDLGLVMPLNAGWNDIGSWESIWEVSNKDKNMNVISGKVKIDNVKNSYLRSEERLIVGIGLEDLIIIETIDAVLVAKKDKCQEVKKIVNELMKNGEDAANTHKTIYRPWGSYTAISQGARWQAKKINVKPHESLSLQSHKYRSEHWIVVGGEALVEIDGNENIIKKNQSAYIPIRAKHRLSNPSDESLILIEVQSGEYLGEDDIQRFDDKYGRLLENKK